MPCKANIDSFRDYIKVSNDTCSFSFSICAVSRQILAIFLSVNIQKRQFEKAWETNTVFLVLVCLFQPICSSSTENFLLVSTPWVPPVMVLFSVICMVVKLWLKTSDFVEAFSETADIDTHFPMYLVSSFLISLMFLCSW